MFIYQLKVIFRNIATTNIIIEILPGLLEKDFVTNRLSDYSFKIIDGIPLIDNISLEYRIDRNATRYVRLFYDNDSQDPLEGTYSSAGAGFVWRNKSSRFGDLFLRPRRKSVDYPSVKE